MKIIKMLLLATLLVAGLAQAEDKVAATVNGVAITDQDIQNYMIDNKIGTKAAGNRSAVLDELIARELVLQKAKEEGVDKRPDVIHELKVLREQVLLKTVLSDYTATVKLSDEELKKLYNERVKAFNQTEYRARHILVKDEAKAKEVIAKLNKGEDFAKLAKQYSTGPTGAKGGELGWFSPENMVPPFSKAVAKLKKGEYTKTPVKTRYGWHVIQLEDTRKAQPPSFDEVKPQLKQVLMQEHVRQYLNDLRKKAKVVIKQ